MRAGVAGGLARYLGADVTLVRVIIAALVLFTGAGAALYLAAWLLIPADGDEESIAAGGSARPPDPSPHPPEPKAPDNPRGGFTASRPNRYARGQLPHDGSVGGPRRAE